MGKLLNKDLYRSVYDNYVRRTTGPILANRPIPTSSSKLVINHTPFRRMSDFSHKWAKNIRYSHQYVKYVDSPNTFAGPKKTTNLLRTTTSLPHAGVGNRIRTAVVAREDPCANYDRMPIQSIVF